MKSFHLDRYVLGLYIAGALVAGCGGSQSPVGAQASMQQSRSVMPQDTSRPTFRIGVRPTSWVSPKATSQPLMFVSNSADSDVQIFPKKDAMQSQIGAINTGTPRGLYVGPHGTLLISDWSGNDVLAYPSGDKYQKHVTYTQDLSRPMFPIVDSGGNLWVSNANNGTVVEYPKGSSRAFQVLQIGASPAPAVEADGMDFDTQGNLYVAYRTSYCCPGGSIEEFTPGSTQGTILGMSLNEPQGVIVDKNGNIIVAETGTDPHVDRVDFFPPETTTPTLT